MSTVTDAEVDAACEAFVRQWDGVVLPSLRADMRSALEAAEAVRVKPITMMVSADPRVSQSAAFMTPAESNLQKVQIPTSTIPEGFIPWHGGVCPMAEGTAVDYVMRDGYVIRESRAENLRWKHINADCDIIAYRIHKPADFRLEAGKFYVTASGERVGPLELGSFGWFMITERRLSWHEDGTCGKKSGPDHDKREILALSSNQENSHD